MGILDTLLKKEQKKPKGICIPDHAKQSEIPEIEIFADEKPRFKITGIFEVRGVFIITGEMLSGRIGQGQKIEFKDSNLVVNEIMVGQKHSKTMEKGESGSLTLKAEKHVLLKAGDVLEFS